MWVRWVAVLAVMLAAPPARAVIDAGINKTVWRMLYGLSAAQVDDPAWLAADNDGDGLTNGDELAAGTNPLQAGSALAIQSLVLDANFVRVTFASAQGKFYRLKASDDLANAQSWGALQPPVEVVGDGFVQTLEAPRDAQRFYRLTVEDIDSDADGVSDWAEVVAGFDPANDHTNGSATDDHTALLAELAKENVVTITASEPATTQPPDATTPAMSTAAFMVARGGKLNFSATTVSLAKSGTAIADTDYIALPEMVTLPAEASAVRVAVTPKFNPARRSNATVTLRAVNGGGYTVGAPASASVVIYPADNANGTGLTGYYHNSTAAEINAGYNEGALFNPADLAMTRNDATVDFVWNNVSPGGSVAANYFAVRWLGQVQPQYSETYYFLTRTNKGVKLWINGQLLVDKWSNQVGVDNIAAVDLKAGVRYDLRMEYYQATGNGEAHLSWYSQNQVRQIIPTSRLYPATATAAPSITSALTVFGFVNQPFTFAVAASNAASVATTFSLGVGSGSLPPGLSLNTATGVLSGIPTVAGTYQVAFVATSTHGTGSSVLEIKIFDTGNAITREVWTSGVTGPAISDIPLHLSPTSTDNSLSRLEDNTVYANNTASRLRGYFTAPTTGNYYVWLAASHAAELWISNDHEPVNNVRRAFVTPPGTAAQIWNAQPNQRSGWLTLVEGRRYYFEVLHNHGSGTPNDHVAVSWFRDPSGTTPDPVANNTGVVPGYLLSPFDYPIAGAASGTLYATNMTPQSPAQTTAVGTASLRLNPTKTQAVLRFSYSGLGSPRTAYHIHSEDFGGKPSQIIYDIDDVDRFHPELRTPDGGYIWNIGDVGSLSAADIVAIIQQGQAYINIHSVVYPAGEIRGNFSLVFGSQTPPVLQPGPAYDPASAGTDAGAARFLNQATFGASPSDIAYVKANSYSAWIDNQFTLPASYLLPDVLANVTSDPTNLYPSALFFNAWWEKAITAPDQLRQRVAFALSEILVVSDTGPLFHNARVLADYYDALLEGAFGNFREILEQVTLTPAMGIYLDMRANQKGNLQTGVIPNENYAREIMQLFSLGLNRLWPDGRLVLDSNGNLVATYDQKVIDGVSRVLTGWHYAQPLQGNGRLPTSFSPPASFLEPMVLVPTRHELGTKLVLDNVMLPAAQGYSLTSAPVPGSEADPAQLAFDTYCLQDLEKALDSMFHNSSVGPFICRQLIQRLVTSHPSPAYLHRVVQKFNDDGSAQHVRGNTQAVIRAILLDGEARSTSLPPAIANTFGKQREPLLRITGPARAFPSLAAAGTYNQNGNGFMTVTTSAPHFLSPTDMIFLDFTGNTPIPFNNPTTTGYTVRSNPAPTTNTFAVNATGLLVTSYNQPAFSNVVTVNTAGPQVVGARVYLDFVTGGAPDGLYSVATLPDANRFTVVTVEAPPAAARAGSLQLPRLNAGYAITNAGSPVTSTFTVGTFGNHNLLPNHRVWIDFNPNLGSTNTDAEFVVSSILDEDHFQIVISNSSLKAETIRNSVVYMLVAPPLVRSGNVGFQGSKYDVGYSDDDLTQTPLNSPTVFNFFFPDYKYPGALAASNITTPEFQLTTDTNVVTLTNAISGAILSSGNSNGLTSFRNGGGTITMDLSPYMTPSQTSNAGIPALIDKLSDRLTGGQLSGETKIAIRNFAANTANFPYTNPTPTNTEMRDRVRAIVHLILTSPEYAIQK